MNQNSKYDFIKLIQFILFNYSDFVSDQWIFHFVQYVFDLVWRECMSITN